MRGDIAVGDTEYPTLDGVPDNATVTVDVAAPDGGTPAEGVAATVADGTATAVEPVTYNVAGRWVQTWTVTAEPDDSEADPATDVRVVEVYVVPIPTAGGPTWTPGRSRVANYLPGRTLVREAAANVPQWTFTSQTRPTGVVVDRLIADAVAWVTAATGTVHESLHDLAATCAALFAASSVELGYPDRETDVKGVSRGIAEDLLKRAKAMRDDLARANAAAGEPPVDAGSNLLPSYAFPAPAPWGDLLL
jgi:hypothetical protein